MSLTVPVTQQQTDLQQWREELLNRLLTVIFVFGGLLLATIFWSIVQNRTQPGMIIAGYALIYILIGIATFWRGLPYLVRCGTLLALLYALGIDDLFSSGLVSDGRIYFFTGSILCALLIGVRSAIVFTVVSIVSLIGVGGWVHNWVPSAIENTPNIGLWFIQTLSQALQTVIVVICVVVLLRRLTSAFLQSQKHTLLVEESAQQAQQQADELSLQKTRLETVEHELRLLVEALETPIVELADRIILVPIVGSMDSARAQTMTNRLLTHVHTQRISLAVIDLAGLPLADTYAIHALQTTAAALRLLGCRVIFTGFSPELAITFQSLGTDLNSFDVRRSAQDVLQNETLLEHPRDKR